MSKPIKITVFNLHPIYKPSKGKIARLAKRILGSEKVNLSLGIVLVNDNFIRQLNAKFRKKDRVTDVLSFGMKEGKKIGLETDYLGDVYVCLSQAKRQAREYRIPFAQETHRLVAHGILHLLGYNHNTKKQGDKMKKREDYFIAQTRGKRT